MSVINKKVRQTDITQILVVFVIYKSTKETSSLGMSSVAMTEKQPASVRFNPPAQKVESSDLVEGLMRVRSFTRASEFIRT